jgi:hypothetical protein
MRNWTSKDIAEMIGILAIVLSLLFVGLQMKQSQEIAIAAQYQERANAANDVLLTFMETATGAMGSQLADSVSRGEWPEELVQRVESMAPDELEKSFLRYTTLMILYDNNLFQYESGFLDEDSWLAFRARMINVLTDPLNRQFYRQQPSLYRPRFRVVVEEAIVEIENR